ncbi:unnamed protein product [Paramecium octaurelia]|uniref:Heat shock protein 70 n=1 Tax=Paramecium octaurelia TaxID=43137 RepID=A0A8S1TWY1_PAROT|nr:unnamed protein product [Paramecium octaurelia]
MYSSSVIGIDLGTTYSCVGICIDGSIEIILNDQGNRITPSCVAFTDTERLIGDAAKNQAYRNPQNTVFDVKRLVGRQYSEYIVQQDIKLWPFKVEASVDDKPMIVVKYKGENKKFYPEEISSMVLTKIKKNAEAYLGRKVSRAVISVPAYFNTLQRQATRDAATIAGLQVLKIINEPNAAAIAYNQKVSEDDTNILIFDLGGGTLDVSLLEIQNGVFDVKATAGDTHLGGEDFDNKLVQYCCQEFLKKKGIDIRGNPRALRRLRTQCERAKRVLSSANQTTIEVDSLEANEDFICTISRAKFEELCLRLFEQCIHSVEKLFKDSCYQKNEIHEVVLVGGSTRIPKIQELLRKYFDGKELNQSINPDEAVAYGAAVYAATIQDNLYFNLLILDITPQNLGIQTDGGEICNVVPKYTSLPTSQSRTFLTNCKVQKHFEARIFEGGKNLLTFCVNDAYFPNYEDQQIEITFRIDEDSNMKFFFKDYYTKRLIKDYSIVFQFNLSQVEIQKLVKEAEQFNDESSP